MNATLETPVVAPPSLESAIESALGRVAPLWPLGRFVAVNPFAGLAQLPFAEACEILQRTTGSRPRADSRAIPRGTPRWHDPSR